MPTTYLALDIGGGSGRGIAGTLDGHKLVLEEVSRFENYYVPVAGKYCWDIFYLFHEMIKCVQKAQDRYENFFSFCADLWGSDFAFLDKNGQPIGYPWCTRNSDGRAMEAFFRDVMSEEDYFAVVGGQIRRGNAPFQIYERYLEGDPVLKAADSFLMLPDYIGYLFTGKKYSEFTIATTSQLIDPYTGDWNRSLIRALHLPEELFGKIVMPGTVRYNLRPEVLPGVKDTVKYVPAASHDTASAVTTLNVKPDEVFCSSGTWSIIGIECDEPTINQMVYECNFSNEGTVDGRWRFQKDVMGMWCMQNLFRMFSQLNPSLTWDEVVAQAKAAQPFRSIVNLEETIFVSDADPVETIRAYCEKTGQPVPVTLGEIARCVYESMALRYHKTIQQLGQLSGRTLNKLRIVGGGGKNQFLNQMIADVTGMTVEAGPYESACIGNILMQAVAEGKIRREEFSDIIKESFEVKSFQPQQDSQKIWEAAVSRYDAYSSEMYF